MRHDSRYTWSHTIQQRKNDTINGNCRPREKRISLTFRRCIEGDEGDWGF